MSQVWENYGACHTQSCVHILNVLDNCVDNNATNATLPMSQQIISLQEMGKHWNYPDDQGYGLLDWIMTVYGWTNTNKTTIHSIIFN